MALRSDSAGLAPADQAASQPSSVDLVAANGLVEGASPEMRLWPEAAGILAVVNVHDSDDVKKGQVLAELSNKTQKAQVNLAKADLALAREQLRKLENGARQQDRERAKADLQAKATAYQIAQRNADRTGVAGRGVSASEADATRNQLALAKAEWEKAKAEVALLEEGTRAEDIEIARRQVEAAQAKVQAAEADLAKTQLIAPTDGKVLRVYGQAGAMVTPLSLMSKDPVLVMADLSKRRVRASVEELDVTRVEVGQPATITADGLPGKTFTGTVSVVLWRMGKGGPESDAPNELKDMYFREVLIDLDGGEDLPTNLRVQVRIQVKAREKS
jgi:multidrug resistance efflux pump